MNIEITQLYLNNKYPNRCKVCSKKILSYSKRCQSCNGKLTRERNKELLKQRLKEIENIFTEMWYANITVPNIMKVFGGVGNSTVYRWRERLNLPYKRDLK